MFQKIIMEVNKREGSEGNKKFVKLGDVEIFIPLLKDIAGTVASAEIAKDEKGVEVVEDGLPVYVNDNANWVQGAIAAQVKAQARNKLQPGTATLKEGQKIAETWEELTAEGERGQGAGLAILREFKTSFSTWVKTLGLSEAASNTLIQLVSNKTALSLQPQNVKDKVAARLEAYVTQLDEENMIKYTRPLQGVADACKSIEDAMSEL